MLYVMIFNICIYIATKVIRLLGVFKEDSGLEHNYLISLKVNIFNPL